MTRSTSPLVGVGYRHPLREWITTKPAEIQCLEITAEHFFDNSDLLPSLSQDYPLYVHGLGLSLGTPGPLDQATLAQFNRVVQIADPKWISEHVAFTRTNEVDLGHLNPIAPSRAGLEILVEHARQLADYCGRPLILENITTHLAVPGELSETDFLNQLCDASGCGILLDVTNLWINSRNHRFDPLKWLESLNGAHVRQLHIVGYSIRDGVYFDRHADPIQDELFDLVGEVVRRTAAEAIIIERDASIPPVAELACELQRLANAC